jgi:trimeric autotransporter adhesin
MQKIIQILIVLFLVNYTNAQSVSINNDGSTANTSSILDVKSTTKGILIPRMSKTEKNAIATPANGLLVYQNAPDSIGFHYYNGAVWVWLQNGSEGWSLNGNNNVIASNFLGSINNSPLRFKVNNKQSGIIDSAYHNTSFGYQSLMATTTNTNNTAIGFDAGKSLTTGFGNAVLGNSALAIITNGSENVAIGDSSMSTAINASANTAVGYSALKSFDGQGFKTFNTAIGYRSQSYPTAPDFGFLADNNTSVGSYAMERNISGWANVAVGRSAMRNVDSAGGNVAVGVGALFQNNGTGLSENVAIGFSVLNQDLTGIWNTAVGGEAMSNANGSALNSVVGFRSLKIITGGSENSTLGVGTMEFKDTALGCVAIGRFALSGNDLPGYLNNKPDTGSIAIGTRAGRYNNANYNTFIGFESGIGVASNPSGLTGAETVSIGAFSLNKLQSGLANSTFGYSALFNNTQGSKNIAVGSKSLYGNQTSSYNIGIGDSALYNNGSVSVSAAQATGNIGIGSRSMYNIIRGSDNIGIGRGAFSAANDGNSNIGIGFKVGDGITTGSNNIFIGNNAGGIVNVSDKLFIENSNSNKDNALIYGDFAADSLNLNAKVNIRDFTRLGTIASNAPAIKMKKLTVQSSGALTGEAGVSHLLTSTKIISVTTLLEWTAGTFAPPEYSGDTQLRYNFYVTPTEIRIRNNGTGGALILNKPVTILITYEE